MTSRGCSQVAQGVPWRLFAQWLRVRGTQEVPRLGAEPLDLRGGGFGFEERFVNKGGEL